MSSTSPIPKGAGHTGNVIDVCRKNIHGCLACEYCHGKGQGECSQKDDMAMIYALLCDADISLNTVKLHIRNVLNKTGYKNRLELAINAKSLGLVVHDDDRKATHRI